MAAIWPSLGTLSWPRTEGAQWRGDSLRDAPVPLMTASPDSWASSFESWPRKCLPLWMAGIAAQTGLTAMTLNPQATGPEARNIAL
jgi:hypothetical protein